MEKSITLAQIKDIDGVDSNFESASGVWKKFRFYVFQPVLV